MDSMNKEHYLGLKVMRLLKPSLYSNLPFHKENEVDSNLFEKVLLGKVYNANECQEMNCQPDFSLSDFLVLPQSFGNIFIGEIFSSYLCIHNHSQYDVKDLTIKVELQLRNEKIPIPLITKHGENIPTFSSDQTFDALIQHAVKELGVHVLICNVSYTNEQEEKMSFKKFFKFIVAKPFEIQPKFPYHESENAVLFEAQIQNITNNILFMEKVVLEPMDGLKCENLNNKLVKKENEEIQPDASRESVFGRFNYMKPTEIKQYLFKITSADSKPLVKPVTIGKLDIIWRNPFSDLGRLQTNPLTQPQEQSTLNKKEIEVKILETPEISKLEEAIDLKCEIKNVSERTLDLLVKLENNPNFGYLWNCSLCHKLGSIKSNESSFIDLNLVPIQSGHLQLLGIKITELFLKRDYDLPNLISFVVI